MTSYHPLLSVKNSLKTADQLYISTILEKWVVKTVQLHSNASLKIQHF